MDSTIKRGSRVIATRAPGVINQPGTVTWKGWSMKDPDYRAYMVVLDNQEIIEIDLTYDDIKLIEKEYSH